MTNIIIELRREADDLENGGQAHEARVMLDAAKRIETLESALIDLASWFTTPSVGGRVWMIPAGKGGADDAVTAARAAISPAEAE